MFKVTEEFLAFMKNAPIDDLERFIVNEKPVVYEVLPEIINELFFLRAENAAIKKELGR